MPKRFTDTEKWKDDWWGSLSNDYRIIWLYLVDSCSIAGIWKKDLRGLNFNCNTKITEDDLKGICGDRLVDKGNYFFIPKFLRFQCPKGLNSYKPAIVSIVKELIQNNLTETVIESLGNDFLIIKGKRKGKGTGKGTGKGIQIPEEPQKTENDLEVSILEIIRSIKSDRLGSKVKAYKLTPERIQMIRNRQKDFKKVWPEPGRDFYKACKYAFEYKAKEWFGNENMFNYFAPETLLGKKFVKYLESAEQNKGEPYVGEPKKKEEEKVHYQIPK